MVKAECVRYQDGRLILDIVGKHGSIGVIYDYPVGYEGPMTFATEVFGFGRNAEFQKLFQLACDLTGEAW